MVDGNTLLAVLCVTMVMSLADRDVCHDVTVVGGGIGGTYAAWKLRHHELNIGLYEFSDRLGGRFYTYRFPEAPDIPIELGAMRFNNELHPILSRTIQELGLKTGIFRNQDYFSDETMLFLRGVHFRNKDFSKNHVPYNLRQNERKGIQEIYRYLTQKTNFSGDLSSLQKELPFIVSDDNASLSDQTISEFFSKYLSDEAIEMVTNILKFNSHNPTAAHVLHFMPENFNVDVYMTISEGIQQLPEHLVKQFIGASRNHSVHTNHQLISITRNSVDGYTLGFMQTVTSDGKTSPTSQFISVCSQRVILTVPPPALLQINLETLQQRHILSTLKTLNYHVGVKVFLLYDYPWWRDHLIKSDIDSLNSYDSLHKCPKLKNQYSNYYDILHSGYTDNRYDEHIRPTLISDLPIDMTLDFGISNRTGRAVLLAAYSVHDLWSELQKNGEKLNLGHHSVSTEVVRHAHMYLAKLYNINMTVIPTPTAGVISHWDQYPYKEAFSTSKTGVDKETVWRTIHKPSAVDNIFIASGSYSKRTSDAWSEYCLEAVEGIISTYFGKN
ncbi:aplysianin-A-like [Ylistrum balloti]|uniref:aplysianin-A-like n=1 Tax=Ylistrum balloti TaxID=509963 RepID=UPI0029059033|nr:aplysianin-A-like [Ylistrum balloti]